MRLLRNDKDAHIEAKEKVDSLLQKLDQLGQGNNDCLTKISEWHDAHISRFKEVGENISRTFYNLYHFGISQHELLTWLAARIDLPIEA